MRVIPWRAHLVDPAFLGPDEEGADRTAGGFVDFLLGAVRAGAVMAPSGVATGADCADATSGLLVTRHIRFRRIRRRGRRWLGERVGGRLRNLEGTWDISGTQSASPPNVY